MVDAWIASVAWDYPGVVDTGSDDTKIPLANVWFRVAYGLGYLGDAEVTRLRDIYEAQGIGFYGVIVPSGTTNWSLQRSQALAALRLCRGLEFDVEPYGQYLGSEAGLQAWLENVLAPLRADHAGELAGKDISLCYDPREQWLDGWQFSRAASLSDSLAAMVYTGMFSGPVWGDPIKAIQQARQQCPGDKVFRPILQTYAIDPAETLASFGEAVRRDGKPILFRRGVTPTTIWRAIDAIPEPTVMIPAASYPVPPLEVEMSSQEYNELRQWVQVSVHDAIVNRIAALEQLVERLPAAPKPAAPAPPAQRTYTVQPGDTLSGIAVKFGVAATRWPEIPNLPPEVRADPRKLQAGFVLQIPW